ncbi:MAG: phosphotriesterase-related protein [Planctomycetes bacterium]|nr:phosphotriesterase-related protein [Planctomycetota bacterium]
MAPKIVTVSGEIEPCELGVTLPHEHLLVDTRAYWKGEPEEILKKELVRQPVCLKNRGEVVYSPFSFLDNLHRMNPDDAIEEAMDFKKMGGNSIVDLTNGGLGRNPMTLYSISKITGLNIIMGAGYYIPFTWADEVKNKTELEIAKEIIKEFQIGVKGTGIKPGIIGEIGVNDIENGLEIKNLRASAKAQKEIGCGLSLHQPNWINAGNKILDVLEKEGVDLNKVVLAHCDTTLEFVDEQNSLAKRGAYIEYDFFGAEFMSVEEKFLPSDGDRIKAVRKQIELGNLERILISHDLSHKIACRKWGGFGLAHILRHIVPRLRQEGLTDGEIKTIIIKNPMRLLSF